jgi:hypothetical protein
MDENVWLMIFSTLVSYRFFRGGNREFWRFLSLKNVSIEHFCHSVSKKALFGIKTDDEKQPLRYWPPGTQSSAAKPTFRPGGTKSNDLLFYCTKLRNF